MQSTYSVSSLIEMTEGILEFIIKFLDILELFFQNGYIDQYLESNITQAQTPRSESNKTSPVELKIAEYLQSRLCLTGSTWQ